MALRVLIVDDNDGFLAAARALLERGGVAVVGVAKTGAEALVAARRLGPDASLVDIDLGAESGFDVARRFEQMGLPSRVILISTHDEGDFTELIADSPAVGFLPKSRLSAEAIESLLERTPTAD
jgi:two-component system, NarL family, nitrate/nitrite response regulator NarL